MIRVAHVLDDLSMGGVVRMLDALITRLDDGFIHTRHALKAAGTPPQLNADIIVLHSTLAWRKLPWLAALRARNGRAALVIVEHSYCAGFETRFVPSPMRLRAMLRLGYGLADRVVSVSHAQAAWIEAATGLSARHVAVIEPLTDLAPLRALPLREDGRGRGLGGRLRLCGYGRFAPQKGFDTLIEAMRHVDQRVAELVLVGAGPEEARLRQLAAGLAHVSFEPAVPSPAALFGRIDALAIPSRFEPYGCVAGEARAAGLPMIVSTADGLMGHFVPSAALRVPPEDALSLAESIAWLARQDLARLGAQARASIMGAEAEAAAAWRGLLGELAPARVRAPSRGVAACARA